MKFDKEKRLFRRKILFLLVILLNEAMIWFLGDEYFLGTSIARIGSFIRILLAILLLISVGLYIKEKIIVS